MTAKASRCFSRLTLLLPVLALLGALLSLLLWQHHRDPELSSSIFTALCGGAQSGCDQVNRSAAARFLGLPVAQWGYGYYSVFLVLSMVSLVGRTRRLLFPLVALAAAGVLVDLALGAYSVLGIGTICNLCAITYGVTALILVVTVREWRRRPEPTSAESVAPRRELPATALALVFGLLAVLATGGYVMRLSRPLAEQYVDLMKNPDEALYVAWTSFHLRYKQTEPLPIDISQSPSRGSANPVMSLVLFADFACPYCKRAASFLSDFVDRHRDAVRLTFKHYPLDNGCNEEADPVHVGSCTLARAGIAAGKQDRFWYYHDLLFANQHLWKSGVSPTQLVGLAAKTGFDAEAFESELDSEEALDRVRADVEEAHTLGVEETPVLFVNGRRMEALPVSEFLEELLRQEAESKRPFSIPESVRAESMVAQGQRSTP